MGKLNQFQEVSIVYRRPELKTMRKIQRSCDMVEIFREYISIDKIDLKEFFAVALLSRSNHVLGLSMIGQGSTVGTVVNIKEIFQLSIKANATGIILCHNHPSGNLLPSDQDVVITKKIKELCGLCDITLLDHIIISSEGYYSFVDEQYDF